MEFSFPGPRLLRFFAAAWNLVRAAARETEGDEVMFGVRDTHTAEALQAAVDYGYLVPYDPLGCALPAPNDMLPCRE